MPSLSDIPHIVSASQIPNFNDGMAWDPPQTPDELVKPYEANIAAWEAGTGYAFTAEDKTNGEFIGRIAMRRITGDDGGWNLGFWTHPTHQRQGYMTECVRAILALIFCQLNAQYVEACHALWNAPSERVIAKAGFRYVGTVSDRFMKHGKWVEEKAHRMTRNEWLNVVKTQDGIEQRAGE